MKKYNLKFVLFLILIILLFFIGNYFDILSHYNPSEIKNMVEMAGILGPLIFILLYIIASMLFLPGAIFSISSGAIFGSLLGTIYTVIGATIGATMAFLISRYFVRSFFEQAVEKKYKKIKEYDNKLKDNGFITVLFLRLVPFFPFNGLNFALGVTRVRLKEYVLATLIGIIPGTFLYAYLGDSIIEMNYISVVVSLILIILLALLLKYLRKLNK